jgi:hypothetical protein
MEILSAASTSAFLASVSSAFHVTSSGVYAVIALGIALPTMFWFFIQIKRLFDFGVGKLDKEMFQDQKDVSTVEYVEHRMRRADFKL